MQKVFFTSDTHFFHKNILKHCPLRKELCNALDENDISSWDDWMVDRWNKVIGKHDIVYIIGDFAFGSAELAKKILGKLNGKKFLILGNHDGSSDKLDNYFKQITQQKMVVFKKEHYDFLEEDIQVFMCHYPLITWPSKHYGAIQLHGHCHGRMDDYNEALSDLRVDVGIDSTIAEFEPVPLEKIYKYFKSKTNGKLFKDYAIEKKEEDNTYII